MGSSRHAWSRHRRAATGLARVFAIPVVPFAVPAARQRLSLLLVVTAVL